MPIKQDVVLYLIIQGPGRTAVELSQAIHGYKGIQQNANQECEMLARAGKIERRGAGGPADPYRHFPK
jgi:hypothetical protein